MPKIKTNRSAAKRFKKTGSGKIQRAKSGKNHFTGKKSIKSSSLKPVLLASFNAIRTPNSTPVDINTPYHITSIPNILKATGFIFSPFNVFHILYLIYINTI
jgi:hypothetical protein